jgi:hypothetical protein
LSQKHLARAVHNLATLGAVLLRWRIWLFGLGPIGNHVFHHTRFVERMTEPFGH